MTDQEKVEMICTLAKDAGGKALLVGGYVRDKLLNIESRDFDIEVYGLDVETIIKVLSEHFKLDVVGASFGVIKIHGAEIDVSIPRRESKSGTGHKGFIIHGDPDMSVEEASARRDFTINSMAFDPLTEKIIDPHNGQTDLFNKILRHTSSQFSEDPLRVLRGMQFCARFKLEPADETIELCKQITMEGLAHERIFEEWRKLVLKGKLISLGLEFLRKSTWIRYFPELKALIGLEQNPDWHPEGDVWNHTLHCMDAFASERTGNEWDDLIVGFAVLCHDFGKPATTEKLEDGRIVSRRHEKMGEEPTISFLSRMTHQTQIINEVVPLVTNHLSPLRFHASNVKKSTIRRLANRVGRIDRLVRVARADRMGRPPKTIGDFPEGEWLLEKARELQIEKEKPKPIMMGRHLIRLGVKPGPIFGKILDECYESQLDGVFSDEKGGTEFVKKLLTEKILPEHGNEILIIRKTD